MKTHIHTGDVRETNEDNFTCRKGIKNPPCTFLKVPSWLFPNSKLRWCRSASVKSHSNFPSSPAYRDKTQLWVLISTRKSSDKNTFFTNTMLERYMYSSPNIWRTSSAWIELGLMTSCWMSCEAPLHKNVPSANSQTWKKMEFKCTHQ